MRMAQRAPQFEPLLEYAAAMVTYPGQTESGDRYLVLPTKAGMLIAVIDGVGHGSEAAEAAEVALATLRQYADESLISLFKRCHEKMRHTRGAVMSLATYHALDHTVTLLGVGNVEGVLLRADAGAGPRQETIMTRAGVVGFQLPPLIAVVLPVGPGDLLVFATDGIRTGFEDKLSLQASPQQIADGICAQYSKGTDDALVLVARFQAA